MSFHPRIGNDWVIPIKFYSDYSEYPSPKLIPKENWTVSADILYRVRHGWK